MQESVPFLDCCKEPVLETLETLLSTEHNIAAIRRCQTCGCHWFYRLREYNTSCDKDYFGAIDEDDRRVWCVRLTPVEADALAKARAMPALTFFADKPGIVKDEDGTTQIQGVPYFLR